MSFTEVIFLLGSFVFILGATYFTTKKIAQIKLGNYGGQRNMQFVEALPLAANQFVYIVKIGDEYHLFCSSKEVLNYGAKIEGLDINLNSENTTTTFSENIANAIKSTKVNLQKEEDL
ncbi:MAG: hypothetical protein ATN36_00265 [Epulopiscium sp. Nele67-Bin005]|nr:MAG: hypothetical protein ATN36_00265 [Epulopiscium sp. Nele67-Bin005]